MDVFRTPDERFEDLPGLPLRAPLRRGRRPAPAPPRRGQRRRPVLCFHGEPSWSYLYRHMLDGLVADRPPGRVPRPRRLRPLRQADRPGLVHVRPPRRDGQPRTSTSSTSRTSPSWSRTGAARSGCAGPSSTPTGSARLVILNTGLFTGRVSKGFMAWREFAERTPDLPIGDDHPGRARRPTCRPRSSPPTTRRSRPRRARPGAQRFPLLVPLTPDDDAAPPRCAPCARRWRAGTSPRWSRSPTATRCSRSRGRASSSPSCMPDGGRAGAHRGRRALPAGGRGRAIAEAMVGALQR